MGFHYNVWDNMSDGAGLLTLILVRYPEVATINFNQEQQILKLTFIIRQKFNREEIQVVKNKVLDSIEVYNLLEDKKPGVILIGEQDYEQFTLIEIQRDVDTLVQEEISLIVKILYDSFGCDLVTDQNSFLFEDDLLMQEEIIEHMLENVKYRADNKSLYAFREEGRVLVFNK